MWFPSLFCVLHNGKFIHPGVQILLIISKLWRFPIMIYLCVRLSVHPASLVQGVFSLPFTQFDPCLTHSVLGLNVCSDFEPSFKAFVKVIANFVESLSMPYNFFLPFAQSDSNFTYRVHMGTERFYVKCQGHIWP